MEVSRTTASARWSSTKLESLREATADDIGGILQLIQPFEQDGTLVKRDRTEIERDIGHYTVIEHDGVICAPPSIPSPRRTPRRWRRWTVSPQVQTRATANACSSASSNARAMGLEHFVLTTRTMHWFIKRGFQPVDADWLPRSAQAQIQLGPAFAGPAETAVTRPARYRPVFDIHRGVLPCRTVNCQYLKKEAEGMDFAPYPGELGNGYANISKEAGRPG